MIFAQKVIMRCNQYVYLPVFRNNLIDLGYTESEDIEYNDMQFITNNYQGNNGVLGVPTIIDRTLDRIIIEEFNPKLFLALAAMTTNPTGISGAYFICRTNPSRYSDYRQIVKLISVDQCLVTVESINGYQFTILDEFFFFNYTKADVGELIDLFGIPKIKENQMGKFNLDEEYPQPHNEICDIVNILTEEPFEYEISDGKISYGFIEENEFDLILRPLSDINKEIEHKGEKFVPSEWFELGDDDKHCLNFGNNNIKLKEELETIAKHNLINDINYLPFAVVQKLIEWHFNLMDKEEEFVDVNTLEENPYK